MAYRRPLKKRILNSKMVHFILSWVVSVLLRAVYLTCRKEMHIPESARAYLQGQKPAIFCFWHGRMIMQLFKKPRGRKMFVLASRHNDGSLIAEMMLRFDINTVRGSKKLGGAQAVRNLMQITEKGANISITPDGPRGPFQVAAEGAAFVASKTGYPLVFITFSATRHWRLRSWDKFMIPKPFSRICFVVGEPQAVLSDATDVVRTATHALQECLDGITVRADAFCGVAA